MLVQFIVSGALVGFVVGVTGVGGGSLMTPLLTLFFGVSAPVAVGTDLVFAAVTKAGGAFSHARRGHVPWLVVRQLALGSIPAALAAIVLLRTWHPDPQVFEHVTRVTLGVALMLTAVAVAGRERLRQLGLSAASGRFVKSGAVAAGAVIGFLVALTSVGAGAIGVVALFFLFPALSVQQLVAADIAHAVPLTLVAGLGHFALGTVNVSMLMALLLGSLPAIYVGTQLAARLPERFLRIFLSVMLALIGLRMLAH